jgi:hypothetical protein
MSELRDLSPELKAAQELLYQKRAEARAERMRLGLPVDVAKKVESSKLKVPSERVVPDTIAEIVQQLPPHLGWGSETYSQLVRRSKKEVESSKLKVPSVECQVTPFSEVEITEEPATASLAEEPTLSTFHFPLSTQNSIRVFGHILDCLHRAGLDGPGRVWLLLRHLDPKGEGRVSLPQLRQALTEEGSSLKCLSWKRLRQLLAEGQGKLWARDTNSFDKLRTTQGWVYYFGEARIARLMNLKAIRGWAVEIPVTQLLGSIQEIRALFHDAFHSGRGDGFREPITRRVMESRGGGDGRTQRSYEKKRGITKRANFASLGRYTKAKWQQAQGDCPEFGRIGGPAFTYVDYKGVLGTNPRKEYRAKKQQHWENIYIMRQLGNSYAGSLPTVKRGRKWTNRKLKHLCKSMPLTGTFEGEGESSGRFYYRDEETATKALLKGDKPLNYAQHPTAGAGGYWQELDLIRVANERNLPFEVVDNPSTSSGQAMDFYL